MARAGLAHTPSTILTVSTVLISSSIFETELAIGEYWSEGEPTEPSLLSTGQSSTIPHSLTLRLVRYLDPSGLSELTLPQGSHDISLLLSPEPSVSMNVSIATLGSQIPSIDSQLATIVSEPPHEILTQHQQTPLISAQTPMLLVVHNIRSSRTTYMPLNVRCWICWICCAGGRPGFPSISQSILLTACQKDLAGGVITEPL